ncbi:hypothetical protein HAX54_016951 [Datura stramonium]|uniref:SWIB domain-containing protein n=1 Tax=Datura stramonium TaxID=4076 RepID=A0ABS8Y5I8_DATST|nr:hypothetical protein [Datura stramonium]
MNGEAKKKGGFNKPCALSPHLQKLIGRQEDLGLYQQNPQNKRKILCDEVLSGIFRVKTIDMFQMKKVLSSVKRRLPKQGREKDALVKFFGNGENALPRADVAIYNRK